MRENNLAIAPALAELAQQIKFKHEPVVETPRQYLVPAIGRFRQLVINRVIAKVRTSRHLSDFPIFRVTRITESDLSLRKKDATRVALRLPMQVVQASVAPFVAPTVRDTAIVCRFLSGLRGHPPGVPAGVLDAAPPVRVTFFADRFLDGHATRL